MRKNLGFTLIEFLVVLSIMLLIVPTMFGIMYALLRQQTRIVALQEVKRQGDLVFNHIKTKIRNSATAPYNGSLASPTAICDTAPSTLASQPLMYFLNAAGGNQYFGYSLSSSVINFEQTGITQIPLTDSSSVTVSGLAFGCTKSTDFSETVIDVAYLVTEPTTGVSLNYKTYLTLKSH